ncbi:Type IV leader peptidase family protein [Pelotomaculum sp. FP]|uniref:A24 family peptidase n=1 Tax=Pelotomaculum sp. FP TaxID=261474 RepID=UPI0010659C54|nr:A24 family peptidase [Pelotomaculum sp. FP]TEB16844.1 Type IV leader peptidase family protein [Pelotomaculum sp. FP]
MLSDVILFSVLAICLYTDVSYRKIYNFVLLPAFIAAVIYHLLTGGLGQSWWAVQGFILGIALLVIPFTMGGIGAGDVKLLGIIGVLKGPDFVVVAFLASAIVGGIMSAVYLIKQKKIRTTLEKIGYNAYLLAMGAPRIRGKVSIDDSQTAVTIPYGAAIAAYFTR